VDLSVARRQLEEALGNSSQTYWNNMKMWYKQKVNVGKCICLTVTLDCNNTPLKTALSTSDKII